ncbi:MAG: response regulator [Hyphomicrobiaceae bacterium]|nr:response regulator [Hyphomicrobiaceae bacterium]
MAIVIVDDSVTCLVVLKHLSAAANHGPVQTYSDPRAALAFLADNDAELLIVDCLMPHIDGITLVSALRGNPRHERTPVVMVTQVTDEEVRKRALAAGVTSFLSKPVSLNQYKYAVQAALGRERAAPAAPAAPAG